MRMRGIEEKISQGRGVVWWGGQANERPVYELGSHVANSSIRSVVKRKIVSQGWNHCECVGTATRCS